jgi:hypothetical protein
MVNYLAKLARWISPEDKRADIKTFEDIAIHLFRDRFKKPTVPILRREPLWHVACFRAAAARTAAISVRMYAC